MKILTLAITLLASLALADTVNFDKLKTGAAPERLRKLNVKFIL